MGNKEFDAIVVGSGPNGLAAAILLRQHGLKVLLIEAKAKIGGGLSSAELTLPGFVHDTCSAIHPLAIASPFFSSLPLAEHGLRYVEPEFPAAHPFENGRAAILQHSLLATARDLGVDEGVYRKLIEPISEDWQRLKDDILAPFHFPYAPLPFASFSMKAIRSATGLGKKFQSAEARGLWAGMAAHSLQPLTNIATSAVALVLMTMAHDKGWPIPIGGSYSIAKALGSYFEKIGGFIQTGFEVKSLDELPTADVVLLDITPRQLIRIAGKRLSSSYIKRLEKYRYGMGVFKIDFALDGPVPFLNEDCRKAGTLHLGNTMEEIVAGEQSIKDGKHSENPFLLFAQQSLFDSSRAPAGKHTAWAYCHVPNGSTKDMTEIIEKQIERFAPGFRERILAKHTMTAQQMEAYNPNYVGGDINGGIQDIRQLYTRPLLQASPYRTSAKGVYLCSSATPPGGGVHGMCGYHAAKAALKDIFNITLSKKKSV